jgi:hypothetical protein
MDSFKEYMESFKSKKGKTTRNRTKIDFSYEEFVYLKHMLETKEQRGSKLGRFRPAHDSLLSKIKAIKIEEPDYEGDPDWPAKRDRMSREIDQELLDNK